MLPNRRCHSNGIALNAESTEVLDGTYYQYMCLSFIKREVLIMVSSEKFFRKLKLLLSLALLLIIQGLDGTSAMQSKDLVKEFVFPGGFDVNTYEQKEYHTYTISYSVKLPYPSQKVIEFYDRILGQDEWFPYVEAHRKYADRVWQDFVDETQKGSPLVHQLFTQWKKGSEIAFLSLRYYSYDLKQDYVNIPSNDVQNVALQFHPFIAPIPPGVVLPLSPDKEK